MIRKQITITWLRQTQSDNVRAEVHGPGTQLVHHNIGLNIRRHMLKQLKTVRLSLFLGLLNKPIFVDNCSYSISRLNKPIFVEHCSYSISRYLLIFASVIGTCYLFCYPLFSEEKIGGCALASVASPLSAFQMAITKQRLGPQEPCGTFLHFLKSKQILYCFI